jgi:pyruvate dehydrogenase E2 component (dihydrolipoamide acetyltransferase)
MVDAEQKDNMGPHGVRIAEVIPITGIRKMMADHMINSHLSCARVTVLEEMNVSELVNLRRQLVEDPRKTGGVKISYTHLFIKAIAQALLKHRNINSTIVDKEIQILDEINIGMAVSLPDGNLIVPVIHDADKKNIIEIAKMANDVTERAKNSKLVLDDVKRGTFTLTNIGMLPESRWTTPIINQGQCGILGTGAIRRAPVVHGDDIVVGSVVSVSFSFDHRIVNGLPASLFLQTLSELLKEPYRLELGIQ